MYIIHKNSTFRKGESAVFSIKSRIFRIFQTFARLIQIVFSISINILYLPELDFSSVRIEVKGRADFHLPGDIIEINGFCS